MPEEQPSKFRMRLEDDDHSDTVLRESLVDRRIDRLNSRVNWVAMLIPVLVVLIIVLAYLDLTRRVLSVHDTGSTEVQALSADLQGRFSSLSVKQAKLEETYNQMTGSLAQANADTEKKIKALETRIRQMDETFGQTDAERASLKDALANLGKSLDPLRNDLTSVSAQLAKLDKTVNKELTQLNGSLADANDAMAELSKRMDLEKDRLNELQQALADLSSNTIDQKDIASALDGEKKIYRDMMRLVTEKLENRMDDMQTEIEAVKKSATAMPGTPGQRQPDAPAGEIVEKSLE